MNILTKAKKRIMIEMLFRTQDLNIKTSAILDLPQN